MLELLSLFVSAVFLIDIVLILVPFLRHRPDPVGDTGGYDWHLFVPARDEEAVIGETIARVRRDFPIAHVWVIDDDSDDATAAVVAASAARDPLVHLVQRRRPAARVGKGPALNAAYLALSAWLPRHADRRRVIVGVLDADGRLAPGALDYVAADSVFGTEDVGAAQVAVRMENRDRVTRSPSTSRLGPRFSRLLVRLQDLEFMATMSAMQMLRERTGSVGLGGNGQFTRLLVLDRIAQAHGAPWQRGLVEDYELGLHVMLAGYRNRFIYDTYVEQEGLLSVRRLTVQRSRWTQGIMQCLRHLGSLIRSPRLSNAAVVESGYFMIAPWIQLLGLLIWPPLLVATVVQAVDYPRGAGAFVAQYWPLLAVTVLLGVAPFVLWGLAYRRKAEPGLSRRAAWGLGFANVCYVYYTYVTTVRAFARVLAGRRGWAKTRRNAEAPVAGLVASDA